MRIAYEGSGQGADYLRFGSDSMVIKQTVSEKNPTGAGATMYLDGIMVKGNNGTESMQVSIIQEGSGTIEMGNGKTQYNTKGNPTNKILGSMFTTADDGPASVIKQSGSGTININSDYTSATFNVEQTGKGGNITIGATTGKLQSNALTLTDASTFKIQGELELNKGAELTFSINNIVSITGDTVTGMVVDGGKVTGELVSVGVIISADAMGLTSTDGLMVGTSLGDFSVVLVTGLDDNDAITFAGAGVVKEATYTINGESVSVAYTVSDVDIDKSGRMIAQVGARVTAVGGSTPAVPEPATATLSLLALAGLCARRRRK